MENFSITISRDLTIAASFRDSTEFGQLQLDLKDIYLTMEAARDTDVDFSATRARVKALGSKLANALFTKEIKYLLYRAKDIAYPNGLRIMLSIETPEISNIPWETLYDDEKYIAVASDTILTRVILTRRSHDLKFGSPLKILVLSSAPNSFPSMDVEAEVAAIKQSLEEEISKRTVEVTYLKNLTVRKFTEYLKNNYDIIHFCVHGTFEDETAYLALVDDKFDVDWVDSERLGYIIESQNSVSLVVLNTRVLTHSRETISGTPSGLVPKLIKSGIPCVIAHSSLSLNKISTNIALLFSREFYTNLRTTPVDQSVQMARRTIFLNSDSSPMDFATPVIFMSLNVPNQRSVVGPAQVRGLDEGPEDQQKPAQVRGLEEGPEDQQKPAQVRGLEEGPEDQQKPAQVRGLEEGPEDQQKPAQVNEFQSSDKVPAISSIFSDQSSKVNPHDEDTLADSKLEGFEDSPLPIPSKDELENGVSEIREELLINDTTIREIVLNLISGRHILLAGAVGTGKTRLAIKVPKIFWKKDGGYYPEVYTATSDWSTTDIIGGIIPKMRNNSLSYEVQLGCVSGTVIKNWSKTEPNKLRAYNIHDGIKYRGTWLIIDEFNRADIDKAMGQLFTSLDTRELKIPTSEPEKIFAELKIPEDFRIIGTLNTADKHYLFKLSDALKRRFAYIEVHPPTSGADKEKEQFYALENAIKELPFKEADDFQLPVALDKDKKAIVKEGSKEEFVDIINIAYDFFKFVRLTKILGTALLKSVYQTLLTGYNYGVDPRIMLESALNANIIPQLENLPKSKLQTIYEFHFGDAFEFFRNKHKQGEEIKKYQDEFRIFLDYLGVNNPKDKVERFSQGTIDEPIWTAIKKTFDEKKKPPLKMPLLQKSLDDMIEMSDLI
jgi:MoxR-like ATPase